jgi:TP901 family phage tail tape measure protein
MAEQAEIGALRVRLAFDAGEFSRGTKRAETELSNFGKSVSRISERINDAAFNFNSGMRAAERFAGAVSAIIGVTRDFSSGMSNVATLVDTSAESMDAMTQAVLAIGRRTPVALTDLTAGLYDLRSAGTEARDAMGRLEGSARLAVAGLGTTAEAVDLVTSAVNAFGLVGQEAEQVFDQIFKTTKFGKTTISGLTQGFGAVAGTVATAGVKLDEYLASVAALTTTGLPAAQAHTQIRAAIAGMTRESELAKAVFDAMGVSTFKQLIEKSGGMVGAFQNITAALGGNDAQMIKLFGSVEAYNAVIGLTGKQNAVFRQTLDDMRIGADALDEAFAKKNAGMSAALQKMQNAISDIGIALGTALTPAIVGFSETVTGLADAFRALDPEVQTAIATFATIIAVGGPAAVAVGFFANALAALIPVFGAVGAAIAGLIAASGPIGLFVITASAAVTAWQVFHAEIIAIFSAVGNFISDKVDAIVAKITYLSDVVRNAFSSIMSGDFQGAMQGVTDAMTDQFAQIENQAGLVSVAVQTASAAMAAQGENAFVYAGPVIASQQAINEGKAAHNALMAEGKRITEETLTPLEEMINKQARLNELLSAGAITAETYGRAMSQASVFGAKNMDALASSVSSNLSAIFGETKAVAIATALINTFQGITKALSTYPPPLAQIMAGIQAAAGFAQVANIRSQTKTGGGGGGGGASAATAASVGAAGAASGGGIQQSLFVQGINPNDMFSGDTVRGLATKLLDFQRDGGKVVLA